MRFLSEYASRVVGVDLGDNIEVAEKLNHDGKNVDFVQGDIQHVSFSEEFDVVISLGVLHHLPNPRGET